MNIVEGCISKEPKYCKSGHVYSGTRCAECNRISSRRWREDNKEKANESALRYAEKNREKIRQKTRDWAVKNPDKVKARSGLWRKQNPERAKELDKEYRLAHKDTIAIQAREWRKLHPESGRIRVINRRARQRENGGKLSKGIVEKLLALQKGKCACCHVELIKSKFHIDHIFPVSKGGRNDDENIQLLCPSCNHSKSDRSSVDFMQSRGCLL